MLCGSGSAVHAPAEPIRFHGRRSGGTGNDLPGPRRLGRGLAVGRRWELHDRHPTQVPRHLRSPFHQRLLARSDQPQRAASSRRRGHHRQHQCLNDQRWWGDRRIALHRPSLRRCRDHRGRNRRSGLQQDAPGHQLEPADRRPRGDSRDRMVAVGDGGGRRPRHLVRWQGLAEEDWRHPRV